MRVKGLNFIPTTVNFSDLTPDQENSMYDPYEESQRYAEIDKEILLLRMLSSLDSDKERCVLMLEILREYGYQVDYKSCAHALGIEWRWFMRVKKNVKNKVVKVTTNKASR